jgi:LysM repeat protein
VALVLIVMVFLAWMIEDAKRQNQTAIATKSGFAISTLVTPALAEVPNSSPAPKTEAIAPPAIASRPASTAATRPQLSVYVVRSGDSLIRIAKRHGTTAKALRAANDLKADRITIGQKIKIPIAPPRPSAGAPKHEFDQRRPETGSANAGRTTAGSTCGSAVTTRYSPRGPLQIGSRVGFDCCSRDPMPCALDQALGVATCWSNRSNGFSQRPPGHSPRSCFNPDQRALERVQPNGGHSERGRNGRDCFHIPGSLARTDPRNRFSRTQAENVHCEFSTQIRAGNANYRKQVRAGRCFYSRIQCVYRQGGGHTDQDCQAPRHNPKSTSREQRP